MFKIKMNDDLMNVTGAKGRIIYASTRESQDEASDRNYNIETVIERSGEILLDGYTIVLEESDKVQYEFDPETKTFFMRTNDWTRIASFLKWVKNTVEYSEHVHEYIDF